ncbi:hypothetical protein KJ656_14510, partial [bacterium]|nr:hypothetical protein [bacterium]
IAYLFFDVLSNYVLDSPFFSAAISNYLAKDIGEGPDVRIDIWANYFNNLDIFRLIFGVNVYQDPWPEKEFLAYNYHNSFINLHLQTGFMGLITIALIIFSLFKFYRTNQVFFFLLLTVILRWSTDNGIFFDSFDFIPFFFIFYFLKGLSLSSSRFPISSICRYQRAGLGKLDSDISGKAAL